MKKILMITSLLLSLNALADGPLTRLVPGRQVLIDVANLETVALLLNTSNADSSIEPKVVIEKQWSGFECSHETTLLRKANFNMRSWEVQIKWTPGADLSGCIVKVSFPGLPDSRAELYMNY